MTRSCHRLSAEDGPCITLHEGVADRSALGDRMRVTTRSCMRRMCHAVSCIGTRASGLSTSGLGWGWWAVRGRVGVQRLRAEVGGL